MRLPFDLIAVLLLVDTVRSMFPRVYGERTIYEYAQLANAHLSAQTAALCLLGYLTLVWLMNELIVRHTEWLVRFGAEPSGMNAYGSGVPVRHPLEWFGRASIVVQTCSVLLYGAFLWFGFWPIHTAAWPWWVGLDYFLSHDWVMTCSYSSVAGTITDAGPFVLGMILGWIPRKRLVAGIGRRKVSTVSFVLLEIKLTFLPLLLWISFCFIADGMMFADRLLPETAKNSQTYRAVLDGLQTEWIALVLVFVMLLAMALIFMPLAVVHFWTCRPFPDGFLRDRIRELVRRSGVKARKLLLWGEERSGLINACVLGPWWRFRYILISPGLLRALNDDEVEAVIAHELGHAKYGHLTLLLLFVLAMAAFTQLIMRLLQIEHPVLEALLYLLLLAVYFRGFFGMVMRACEREADLASAEMLGTPVPLVTSLEKISLLSGNTRSVYSWHHDSVANRIDGLMRLFSDSAACAAFHDRMRKFRWSLGLFTLLAVAANFWMVTN